MVRGDACAIRYRNISIRWIYRAISGARRYAPEERGQDCQNWVLGITTRAVLHNHMPTIIQTLVWRRVTHLSNMHRGQTGLEFLLHVRLRAFLLLRLCLWYGHLENKGRSDSDIEMPKRLLWKTDKWQRRKESKIKFRLTTTIRKIISW